MRGRFSRALIGLGVAVSAAITALPAAAQSAPLEPVGEWQLTPAQESCSLWRSFGSGTRAVTVTFTSYGPDGSLRVWLAGESIPRNTNKARITRVSFGTSPARELMAINGASGSAGLLNFYVTGPGSRRLVWHLVRGWSVPGDFDAMLPLLVPSADMGSMTVENDDLARLTLNLGDMQQAFALMDQCRMAMVRGWGIEPSTLAEQATAPVPPDADVIFDGISMPPEVVLNHQTWTVQIRLLIDEQGQASDCVVQAPAMPARNQRALCRPFRSATFTPAQNAAGEAVPSLFRTIYTYYIFD